MDDTFFRFERLGLQRNPFGRLQANDWVAIAVIPQPVECAFQRGDALLLLGEKGRGKSTLLRGLVARLRWQGLSTTYEHLRPGRHHYQSDITRLDAFSLDEAQRLYPWLWLPLLARAQQGMRLLLGSHRDDSWLLRLAGLDVTRFDVGTLATPAHVAAVHRRRIAYFTLPDADPLPLTDEAITHLWQHYRDDLRAQEDILYRIIQNLDAPRPITTADIQRIIISA